MRSTFRLGRIAGIEVGIHWSLLVIGVLLVGSLAGGQFPAIAPHAHGSYLAAAVLAVALFFASILAHELAHSVVARRQGQNVEGITLWLLGGVSQMSSESETASDQFRVSIAGPAMTLVLAGVFGLLALFFDSVVAANTLLPTIAAWLAIVNLILGIFNLLPGAPLDGGHVLSSLLWMRNGDRRKSQLTAAKSGRIVGGLIVAASILLVFSGRDFFITALVGFFILSSSKQEEASTRLLRTLDDRTAGEIMRPVTITAPDWTSVTNFGPNPEPALLLGWDDNPTALLPPNAVFAVPPEERDHTQLRALGLPLVHMRRVPTDAPAIDVVRAGLPAVVDDSDGHPLGIISMDELQTVARRDPVLSKSRR